MYVGMCVSRRLKEELAWATDKGLQVISNTILVIHITKELKNKAILLMDIKELCVGGLRNLNVIL